MKKKKKIKFALLVGYNGSGYKGQQINGEENTIEKELKDSIYRAGYISKDNQIDLHKIGWSRAARTDKGVHAAGNLISLKMEISSNKILSYDSIIEDINKELPKQMEILNMTRVTGSFDSKHFASSRTYEYIIPSFAFLSLYCYPSGQQDEMLERWNNSTEESIELCALPKEQKEYRMTKEHENQIQELQNKYLNTHNFHNFTKGTDPYSAYNKRYIQKCEITGYCIIQDIEFTHIQIHGQSFMQHQIRKMIGYVIGRMRNIIKPERDNDIFSYTRYRVPIAPSLGQLLDQVHCNVYDTKLKDLNLGGTYLSIKECYDISKNKRQIFKRRWLYSDIYAKEIILQSCWRWQHQLHMNDFWGSEEINIPKRQENDDDNTDTTNISIKRFKVDDEYKKIMDVPIIIDTAVLSRYSGGIYRTNQLIPSIAQNSSYNNITVDTITCNDNTTNTTTEQVV